MRLPRLVPSIDRRPAAMASSVAGLNPGGVAPRACPVSHPCKTKADCTVLGDACPNCDAAGYCSVS